MIRPLQEEVRSHLRSGVAITNLTQCVEELVLNSLDAGASNITVRIDVPNFKVQVSDNGNGIAFGDLRLVGERYSSSKCHVLKDLEQLNFYGFRGEALASVREICDVLEIVTRHRASYQTFCKVFRNSQVLELAESRFPRTSSGTTVTIHNIFTNLPVRRKSINETLDFERVRHRIASIALIHPNTAFLLMNDSTGAKCLQTHVCKSSVSTFSQLFGNQRSKGLQQAQFEHKNFKVSGFISTDTHHSKSLQFLFVNGRLLLKTRIHKLVNSILGKSELLKKCAASEIDSTSTQGYPSKTTSPQNIKTIDKHGIFVLNIDCLVTEYDICLEPAKTLIEFQDWDSVLYCVQRCVEEFLFKYDLISCSEQSPKSTESRADEDNSVFVERFCHTSLEAFEYKREIETSNVKKSLHSSIVFRPKKAEEGDAVSQNKVPSLERGLSSPSNSLLSHQKHDSNDGDDTVSFTVSSCSNSKSLPRAVSLPCVEKLAPCLDLTSNVGKLPLSCSNKIGDEPLDGNHGNQINYTTTCHNSNTADSSIVTVSSSIKAAVPTLPVSRHCVCSDLQKTSACQCKGNGLSNIQRSLFNKLSKNCRNNTVALSASPESRKACDSAVSLDKEGDLRTHHHLSGHEQIPCPANTGSFWQSSVAKPRSTETFSVTVNTSRSKAMPTFTSPCPITLQRVCTRKRLQSNKETASSGPGLAPKNRRIITLQGSCNRRARYDRDSPGHSSSRKDSECKACSTHVVCCDQIVQKLADNSCNPKLSTSSDSGIVPGTHVHNYPDNLCVTTVNNTGMNSCDSNSGLPALFRDTCDAAVAFDCNQPDTSYPIKQAGSSSLHNRQTQPVERNIVNFAEVPYLNGTEQEGILHKCTESWHQPQKESTVAEKGVSTDQSSESSLEPTCSSGADEKRKSSLSNDWYCTFDALLGRNLFINTRTGHSSFEPPNELNVDNDDCAEASVIEASEVENDPPQQVPHPVAPHLSFSCTPWLPRQDRRQQASLCDDGNSPLFSKDVSRLSILYQEHQDSQEAEEKLCKWTDVDTLKAYEQNLFNTADKSVAEMLDSWQNPVFTAPDKDILTANEPGGCVKNQISVHNVVHPYRFTRDMLTDMRVLRQLDDKFIVGVVSQEGDDDGLLVLIDQHAAHERIRLEQLQSELFEDSDSSPPLHDKPRIKSSAVSPPLEFTLFAEEVQLLTRFQSEIERIGMCFAISESLQLSEETSIFVHRVPSVLVEREVSEVKRGRPSVAVSKLKELVREHLEHVSTTCGVPAVIPKVIFQVISSQACHGAVKFGEPLGVSECQELIKHLSKCQLPFQCAHGRPSVIPLADLRFLAKKMTSQEIVCRPRMARLQSALVKDH